MRENKEGRRYETKEGDSNKKIRKKAVIDLDKEGKRNNPNNPVERRGRRGTKGDRSRLWSAMDRP